MSANNPPEADGPDYGVAWDLDRTGDIDVNTLHRFSEIRGPAVVIQRLKVAMLTPKGSVPLDPEFGFDQFVVGEPDPVAKAEFRRVCNHDPDVESVESIEFTRESGSRLVRATIEVNLTNTNQPAEFEVARPIQ